MVSVSVLGWLNFKIRVLTNSFDSNDDPTLLTLRIRCKGNSNATGPPHSSFLLPIEQIQIKSPSYQNIYGKFWILSFESARGRLIKCLCLVWDSSIIWLDMDEHFLYNCKFDISGFLKFMNQYTSIYSN